MLLPDLISMGIDVLGKEEEHDLPYGFRYRIYSLFDLEHGVHSPLSRTRLASLAIEKVLPIWHDLFPEDYTPQDALDIAGQYIQGVADFDYASNAVGRIWSHADEMLWKQEQDSHIIGIAYGAAQAIKEAISDRQPAMGIINESSTDFDVDPYSNDSAFYASVAYSGGTGLDQTGDRSRRLKFWRWWLKTAVPMAALSCNL